MKREARTILAVTSLLLMFGVVMIFSASAIHSYKLFGSSTYYLFRHLIFVLIGLVSAVYLMSIPVERIARLARVVLIISLAMLTAVLVPGIGARIGGARRWIRFFGFGFQPSEFAKFALVIYLADLVARKRYMMKDLGRAFLPGLAVIGTMTLLILAQPDMGRAVSVFFVGLLVLFVSGSRLKHLACCVLPSVPLLWFAIRFEPYRLRRILVFFDPWSDPRGAGFQLIQSFIALGSGGATGVGLGASRQKLFYLPEAHTDFIFSIVGEELGFIGTFSVIGLFALLIISGIIMAMKIKHRFASVAAFGIMMMIAFEALVNMAVSMGGLPTKGLPLPFVSYGGSSLVAHMAVVGILLNLSNTMEDDEGLTGRWR